MFEHSPSGDTSPGPGSDDAVLLAMLDLSHEASTLDERSILERAIEATTHLTGSPLGFLHFYDDATQEIGLFAWSAQTRTTCTATPTPHYPLAHAGLWADAARTRKPVVVNDYANAHGKRGLPEGHNRLTRFMSLPVLDGERVTMILGVGNRETDYGPREVNIAQVVSNLVWRIVRRRRVEEALRASETRRREAQRVARLGSWDLDLVTGEATWDEQTYELMGLDPSRPALSMEELVARIVEEDRPDAAEKVEALTQEGRSIDTTFRLVTLSGHTRIFRGLGEPRRNAAGQIVRLHGSLQDVTKQVRVEERLQHLAGLVANVSDAVVSADRENRVLSWNPAAERLYGWPEHDALGQPIHELLQTRWLSSTREQVGEALHSAGTWHGELEHVRRDGERVTLRATLSRTTDKHGHATGIVGYLHDISDQRKLEAELANARKMEAVGQLAAGIAHEINTPTQYVSDSVHFLQGAWADLSGLVKTYRDEFAGLAGQQCFAGIGERLQAAEEAADLQYLTEQGPPAFARCVEGLGRVANIVRAMKDFSHPGNRRSSAADLNKAIETTLVVSRNTYKYVADLETDLGELPPVACNVAELNQVFLNLIVNAADAIEARVGKSGERGRITIRTRAAGDHVLVTIQDTGTGIPESVRARLFEPFFTTKTVGRGSGQGLFISHGIVVGKHHGSLTFDTVLGEGTTFRVELPLNTDPPEEPLG